MSDSDIAGSDPDESAIVVARPKRRRVLLEAGTIILVLVVSCQTGHWQNFPGIGAADSVNNYPPGHICAIAATRWEYIADAANKDDYLQFVALAQSMSRAESIFGYLTYPVYSIAKFKDAVQIKSEHTVRQIMHIISRMPFSSYDKGMRSWGPETALHTVVAAWQASLGLVKAPRLHKLELSPNCISHIMTTLTIIHIAAVAARTVRRNFI